MVIRSGICDRNGPPPPLASPLHHHHHHHHHHYSSELCRGGNGADLAPRGRQGSPGKLWQLLVWIPRCQWRRQLTPPRKATCAYTHTPPKMGINMRCISLPAPFLPLTPLFPHFMPSHLTSRHARQEDQDPKEGIHHPHHHGRHRCHRCRSSEDSQIGKESKSKGKGKESFRKR